MPTKKTENSLTPRESLTAKFKKAVRHFHTKTGMEYNAIGRAAIKNPRFWSRMEKGGTITLEKADEVYDFMAERGFHFNQ